MHDPVNHPDHYTDGQYEVIDYINSHKYDFCLGNAVKYISRAGKKKGSDEIEDLKKAAWYLRRARDLCTHETQVNYIEVDDYAVDKGLTPMLREALHYIEAADQSFDLYFDLYFYQRAIETVQMEIGLRTMAVCPTKEDKK